MNLGQRLDSEALALHTKAKIVSSEPSAHRDPVRTTLRGPVIPQPTP
jgi:hypothetical protein